MTKKPSVSSAMLNLLLERETASKGRKARVVFVQREDGQKMRVRMTVPERPAKLSKTIFTPRLRMADGTLEELPPADTKPGVTQEGRRSRRLSVAPSEPVSFLQAIQEPIVNRPLSGIAELGEMVRYARVAMGMNQSEFANHAGVGRRFLSELESGKPSAEFDKALACARVAGIDLFARMRRS